MLARLAAVCCSPADYLDFCGTGPLGIPDGVLLYLEMCLSKAFLRVTLMRWSFGKWIALHEAPLAQCAVQRVELREFRT